MAEWLETVQRVAREAALAEDRERAGLPTTVEQLPPFSYRWEHVQQVVRNGEWLLQQVEADSEIVLAACWLHDVRKGEAEHARQGAAFARELLPTTDFPTAKIDAVAKAILQHEGLWRPAADWHEESGTPFRAAPPLEPIETALLWDADKLAKIGPLALLHFLPMHLFTLQQQDGNTTTQAIIERNRQYLDRIAPRTLASFNTPVAQRRAMKLQAASELFWNSAEQMLQQPPGVVANRNGH